jgi:hypothetical protein
VHILHFAYCIPWSWPSCCTWSPRGSSSSHHPHTDPAILHVCRGLERREWRGESGLARGKQIQTYRHTDIREIQRGLTWAVMLLSQGVYAACCLQWSVQGRRRSALDSLLLVAATLAAAHCSVLIGDGRRYGDQGCNARHWIMALASLASADLPLFLFLPEDFSRLLASVGWFCEETFWNVSFWGSFTGW